MTTMARKRPWKGIPSVATEYPKAVRKLFDFTEIDNLLDVVDEKLIEGLGQKVLREYEIDDISRADWKERMKEASKLAMQVVESKTYPWPDASNIKYPLMTTAAIQFAARAYPAVVPATNPVKVKVQGKKSDEKQAKADRVGTHMSYQLLEEMEEWDEDTDKLLHILPIMGFVYRKTYFSKLLRRNVSEMVLPDKVVVNYYAKSLERTPRITEEIELYPNEVRERELSGIFKDQDLPKPDGDDVDAPMKFLEQHRSLDLDDDGYDEPYIVTVHKDSGKVVRIQARFEPEGVFYNRKQEITRVEPVHYYTKYAFLPSLDGSFYDIGFGILLTPINEAINSSVNMMLDAGHLQNVGGGLIANSLRIRGGTLRIGPGEYKQVAVPGGMNMQTAVYRFEHPGPSRVLFELLGMMIEAGKEIGSVKDALTGEATGPNEPVGTTLARIEQGLKVFTAIYKRVFRSMKREYRKIAMLNAVYLNPETYFMFHDEQGVVGPQDYDLADLDITPVSDPASVSDMQKIHRGQFLMPFAEDPEMNGREIKQRVFESIGIQDIEDLWAKEDPPPPPALIEKMHQSKMDEANLEIEQRRLAMDGEKLLAEMAKLRSETILNIAKAESEESGTQIKAYEAQMSEITDRIMAHAKVDEGRLRSMENKSNNGAGS